MIRLAPLRLMLVVALATLALTPSALRPSHVSAASLAFTVNSSADAPDAHPGDGVCATSTGACTVRAAVEEADAQPSGSSIAIAVPRGVYRLPLGPLNLSGNTIALRGAGAGATLLVGQGGQVVTVASGANAALTNLTITGGNAGVGAGGGLANAGNLLLDASAVISNTAATGGGITNTGRLVLSKSLIMSNTATTGDGGGLANAGVVLLSRSAFQGNSANTAGGGISNEEGGSAALIASTLVSNTASDPMDAFAAALGGGLVNSGAMTLTGTTISGNTAAFSGGGISNGGTLAAIDSVVVNNTAINTVWPGADLGGGIYSGGAMTLTRSLVSNNVTNGLGGGLFVIGYLSLVDSTLSGNTGNEGGGVYNDDFGILVITGSAILSNTAPSSAGGGIYNAGGTVTVSDSTFSGNTAQGGGGIFNAAEFGGGFANVTLSYVTMAANSVDLANGALGPLTIVGTIMANSTSGPNCSGVIAGPIVSRGYNLDSGTSCGFSQATDLTNTNPLLGPLAYNGGPTPTMALLPGSPAIDHGGTSANGCPATDQRGVPRPQGPACDIGAYEAVP